MSVRLHPREMEVSSARTTVQEAIRKAVTEQHLTYAELAFILAKETVAWMGYAIQDERKDADEKDAGK